MDSRLKEGWLDNIHLESEDFPDPVNNIFISSIFHQKLAAGFLLCLPAIPQVIKTTGRGSLSVRRRKGLSDSGVSKVSVDPAISSSWTKNKSALAFPSIMKPHVRDEVVDSFPSLGRGRVSWCSIAWLTTWCRGYVVWLMPSFSRSLSIALRPIVPHRTYRYTPHYSSRSTPHCPSIYTGTSRLTWLFIDWRYLSLCPIAGQSRMASRLGTIIYTSYPIFTNIVHYPSSHGASIRNNAIHYSVFPTRLAG